MSDTELQTLVTLFATTYSGNPNERTAAELQIRRVGAQEGVIAALLQIIGSDGVEMATRQACAVYVKNRIYTSYFVDPSGPQRSTPGSGPIADSDKDAIKRSLLPLLSTSPSRAVTLQLSHALKNVVAHDFPEQWPGLLADVKRLLASGNIREVASGTVAALEIVRAFRFRQDHTLLDNVVSDLFPTLVNIATQMASTPPADAPAEVPAMLHYILKAYRTSTMLRLSPHQQSADSLVPWGRLLFQLVNLQIPASAVPADEGAREKSEWWKAKKWAFATLGRLFHRYGNPSQMPQALKAEYGPFAEHFVGSFAPEIFGAYLRQVDAFVSGTAWLSAKCQYQIFTFFAECVKPKSTWTLLKPHVENLVSSFIFPHLCFTPAKQELWVSDPADYVRTSVDEYESYDSPVSAATTFLLKLATSRTKTTFVPMLTFINNVLRSNPAGPQKFGALYMTSALGPLITHHPTVKTEMQAFLVQHVLPSFSSSEGYLRAMACEVVGTLEKSGLEWTDEGSLSNHFQAVAAAMNDPELPVQVHAALALTSIIDNHEQVRTIVTPQIGKVIQDLLRLSEETDLDLLNLAMDKMVEHFQDELVPVAAQLTAKLCESYMRLVREALANEEGAASRALDVDAIADMEDEDKTYAAMGVAKTISTVVSSVDSSPEILAQVQEQIVPIVTFTLENKMLDLFDYMYDLVDVLTFKMHAISPSMWAVFEQTYKLFKTDAIDFLEEMLPALDNFVSYGPEMFKSRPDYRNMILDIYKTAMESEQLGENDRVNGCKLAESMMLNLRDHIDDILPTFVGTAVAQMDIAESAHLKLANLEVLINAVLYNPGAALRIMESFKAGAARKFFDAWFSAIGDADARLPRVHDKKLSILTLCALLELDPANVPETLKEGWPGIVGGALKLFHGLPKAIAARKAMEEAIEEDDSDIDDEDLFNLNDDDDDVFDDETAYLEMLAKENERLQNAGVSTTDDDEEEDISDEEIEEELGFISPLDTVDPYSTFKHALSVFQAKNGGAYQQGTTALSMDEQTFLMEVMAHQPTAELSS